MRKAGFASEKKWQDMDVTLTWDTVFGILDAARKYMVEDYRARLQAFQQALHCCLGGPGVAV